MKKTQNVANSVVYPTQ